LAYVTFLPTNLVHVSINLQHSKYMASLKYKDAAFTVESPDVTYTGDEILAKYTYETVVIEGTKVRSIGEIKYWFQTYSTA